VVWRLPPSCTSKALNEQKRLYDLHLAAQYLGKLRHIENRCTALQNEIEQANAPVEEIAAQLHAIGFVYYDVVNKKAKAIEADLTDNSKEQEKIKNAIEVTQQELGKTKGRIETLETFKDKILKWLYKADSQLKQLQSSGDIKPDETPNMAIARIDKQLATTEETLTELKASIEKIKESIYQFELEKQTVTHQIATLKNEGEKASEKWQAYQNELQNLSHNQTLCELVETDEINPYSPDLENS